MFSKMFNWLRVSEWSGWLLKDPRLWHVTGNSVSTVSSETVSEDSALNYSGVWAATRLLCGTGAGLPLPVYQGLVDEDREKAREHPVYRVMNGLFNPEMPAFQGRSLLWQWQVNRGNCFAEIVREGNAEGGELVALWPIHPMRVRLQRDEDGGLVYEVRNEPGEEPSYLPPWRMFHVPSIITHDGIVGHGVIEHARESVGAGIAMEKYGANWFGKNGGVPRIVIEHEAKWDDTQRKAFREEWSDIHGGANGSKVAILGGGATAKPLSISAEDSQFLETRQHNIEEIARWYGVPPHLLQHLLRATYNNVENLGLDFVKYSLLPWLRLWEQAIWHKLLRPGEREEMFAEHNVDALLRGDAASRAALYHNGINDGWMSPNEARKLENLPPRPGGDRFYVQGAIVALDDDGIPMLPEPAAAEPKALPAPGKDAESIHAEAASTLRRILKRDLRRLLTKESNAVTHAAKKDAGFVQRIDEFYETHRLTVSEAIAEPAQALAQHGVNIDPAEFAVTWTRTGKSAVLEASGTVKTKDELAAAVQSLVESNSWTERPEMAAGGV